MRTRLLCDAISILMPFTLVACNPYYYSNRYYPYDPYGPPPVYFQYGAYAQAVRYSVTPSLSRASYDFAINLGLSDSYDIKAGQLARQRSASPQIRQFAQRAVAGNTAITRSLMTTMQQSGTPLVMPSALDPHHQFMIDDLSVVRGAEFDQRYVIQQIVEHRETIAMLQDYIKSGDNAALRRVAQETLPAAQAGLQLVLTLPGAAGV